MPDDFTILPVALALVAASCFGTAAVLSKRGLLHTDPQTGSVVLIGTTFTVYLLSAPYWMRAEYWFSPGFWVFVANGCLHPMLSMYFALEATRRAGPTIASTFAATAPLFSALGAMVFLGESMSLLIGTGTLAIVTGVVVLSWGPPDTRSLMRAALLFATGAAMIRGMNHTLGKYGLELLPSALMAGFVSFSVSLAGALLIHRLRRGSFVVRMPRTGSVYFTAAGLFIAGAVFTMYSALSLGRVVVVSPLINSYPVFAMLVAFALGDERLSRQAVVGVLTVVCGIGLVSL